jgi:hypothetical protein
MRIVTSLSRLIIVGSLGLALTSAASASVDTTPGMASSVKAGLTAAINPESASLALLGIGLVGTAAVLRRRRRTRES